MPATDEAGDTLIELLFTVVIIAIAFSAMLGAIITAITGSTEHRSLAVDDTILKSIAESAKQQIEVAETVSFSTCASSYTISYTRPSTDSNYTISGYNGTNQITFSGSQMISYWNGSNAFSSSCANIPVQQLTATVDGPQGVQTLSFVVRQPNPTS